MNTLLKSVTIVDKTSDFHNSKVDILIENGIISNIDFNNIDISQAYFEDIFFCGKRILGEIRARSIFDGIITEKKEDNISILMSLSCY